MGPRLRWALGLPRHLYARGWGWLLGHRFLQLAHTGRRSGRTYRTVLEVVRWDPGAREAVVISGWGRDADWLRNLQGGGPVEVTIGRESFAAAYRMLPVDEAVRVFAAYERRNALMRPLIRWVLSRLLGWRFDGSPAARQRMVEQLPLVALRPR